ncbi:MAG: methyltransferase domain-containing protein [Rhodocyclales bacterium GT-UBC]|nr:MAG: methyltransferase domain-containing protein [Rhodocyclales bacterium GT-UBC]
MGLQHSYTLIAPLYDAVLARATEGLRRQSLQALPATPGRILLAGIGTGLDLPHLPRRHHYIGLDLTQAMLKRAGPRTGQLDFQSVQGDTQRLPFADNSFDCAVLHLILAVVPQPGQCLAEISRCLRPGGSVLVLDKFLRPGQRAPLRRLLNPLLRRVATRLDVVFEDLLATTPELLSVEDRPALAGGWFRMIRLHKL